LPALSRTNPPASLAMRKAAAMSVGLILSLKSMNMSRYPLARKHSSSAFAPKTLM
jgi:hypothetical protein